MSYVSPNQLAVARVVDLLTYLQSRNANTPREAAIQEENGQRKMSRKGLPKIKQA